MSIPRPANEDLSQQITNLFSASNLEATYEAYMDSMLASIGRNVTIYAPPAISQGTVNQEQFNPWSREKDPRLSADGEGSAGAIITPITITYKAHVVYGPKAVGPDVPWQLDMGEVQLTTVIGSRNDLENAVEIEIDGIKFSKKNRDIRLIGLTTPKYIISFWSRKATP
jgi:hypothetical protein